MRKNSARPGRKAGQLRRAIQTISVPCRRYRQQPDLRNLTSPASPAHPGRPHPAQTQVSIHDHPLRDSKLHHLRGRSSLARQQPGTQRLVPLHLGSGSEHPLPLTPDPVRTQQVLGAWPAATTQRSAIPLKPSRSPPRGVTSPASIPSPRWPLCSPSARSNASPRPGRGPAVPASSPPSTAAEAASSSANSASSDRPFCVPRGAVLHLAETLD
jgi:hypothetical protein